MYKLRADASTLFRFGGTAFIVAAAALASYVYFAGSGGAGGSEPPDRPARTPQAATPTQPIPISAADSEQAAVEYLAQQSNANRIVAAAKSGDISALMGLIATEPRECAGENGGRGAREMSCRDAGLPEGTVVEMVDLTDNTTFFVTVDFARNLMAAAFAEGEARVTFIAEGEESLGVAITVPPRNTEYAPFMLAGAWFDVSPGAERPITRVRLLSSDWGPQQLFHRDYQARGDRVIWNDPENSPGVDPDSVPTPPPPPSERPQR